MPQNKNQTKYTARREWGANPHGACYEDLCGQWVVRDEASEYLDHSMYRNDLLASFGDELTIDDGTSNIAGPI